MKQDIAQIIQRLYDIDVDVVLTRPDAKFGDYATNVALQLAKPLARNPREIAEEKEAVEQYGSSDSGASLGDILGAALKSRE